MENKLARQIAPMFFEKEEIAKQEEIVELEMAIGMDEYSIEQAEKRVAVNKKKLDVLKNGSVATQMDDDEDEGERLYS